MKKISIVSLLCFLLLFPSCSEKEKECHVNCTEEYRTITVNIEDSEGEPVALDSFRVIYLKTGRDLTLQVGDSALELMRQSGNYPIFTDKYAEEYRQQQLELNFTGFIDGEEVVNEDYIVGADCCHVYHVAGDLKLVL